jgi:hypothetical protein
MGVKPTRDKAEGDRDAVAPDAASAGRVSESSTADEQDLLKREAPRTDIHDLPRNEAPRHPVAGPDVDARAGETASQDRAPTADDIQLEATLLQQRAGTPGVDDWRAATRRFEPGLPEEEAADAERSEADDPDRADD